MGLHFQLGKSINWWPKKTVSLQNLQTFDHFTLTLVVAEKRLNTDIKRVGHRRNLETHSSERYRGSELVARSHCDSLDLHPRNCPMSSPNFGLYLRAFRGHSAFMSQWHARETKDWDLSHVCNWIHFTAPFMYLYLFPAHPAANEHSNGIISSCSSTWLRIAVTDIPCRNNSILPDKKQQNKRPIRMTEINHPTSQGSTCSTVQPFRVAASIRSPWSQSINA